MSAKGVRSVAGILSSMQQLRIKLIGGDHQDIALGQLLEVAKEAIKDDFARLSCLCCRPKKRD